MGPLSKAIDELKFRIPYPVLQETFKELRPSWRAAPISLDEQIQNAVIRPRVLVDCNLVGGQVILVPLEGLLPEYNDQRIVVFNIPKDRTMNRSIISVLSVSHLAYTSTFNSLNQAFNPVLPSSVNEIGAAAQRVANAVSSVPPISNAQVSIVAENTVMIHEQYRNSGTYVLRCLVANDENLANISPRSYPAFATLCELAVKSYIYNTMLFKIDQAYLYGGQELGVMKTYVESLSDAEVMYQTHLNEVWRPTAFMNDTMSYARHLKSMVNPAV